MEKYRYTDEELKFLEGSCIPFAAYQFINKRVVTIAISAGFCDLFGFDKDNLPDVYDLMDNNMYRDTHPDDLAELADAAVRFATEGGDYDVIYRNIKDGEYRIIHAYGKHVYKENGVRLAFVWYTDQGPYADDGREDKTGLLSALRGNLQERSATRRVGHDYLTGLPSMSYFFELAEEGCREIRKQGKTPAILFMDFNGMKSYNHKYGLAEGDRFLVNFTDELIKHFSHDNCSRFSADHFCVYTDFLTALEQSQRIVQKNLERDKEKGMPIRIGIYSYDDQNISISAACDMAKIACDSNKKNYESRAYLFDKSMEDQLEKKRYVVENIDKAIENKWIKVFFQPIVRATTGRVCAEEALARWEDPENGFLSPADFIPALEEANTIYKLDLFVVEGILRKMKDQADRKLFVVPNSVNLSRSDFYTCDIVEEIRKRVDKAHIGRDRLIIEITESTVVDDIDYMISEINRFKELGFTVWMDDYGSGYSSPVILQKVPFDLLKIDMVFVRQLSEGEKAKIILTEMVKMALSLGMDTIAEGVEALEQVDFLREIGCTMLQGFYFSKPNPIAEIFERYEKGTQIGFENPSESGYYAQIGRVNLYDLSRYSEDESLRNYFDIWPMLMVECDGSRVSVIRCNSSFREFFERSFGSNIAGRVFDTDELPAGPGVYSLKAVLQCARDGKRVIVDDRTPDGKILQLLIRRVAVNPVTGVSAVVLAVLSASDRISNNTGLTYNYIARALSEDYIFLYFINLDTGEFTEYAPDGVNRDISVERRGKNFFKESLDVANRMIYKDDLEEFLKVFTKENIIKSIEENGTFTLTYRNMIDGQPVYVNMKIVRSRENENNIILGINNVDAQMKQKEALEKAKEEQLTYSRIIALSGDYLAIYTVDPATDDYAVYTARDYYHSTGVTFGGQNFYDSAFAESEGVICPDDIVMFKKQFTKEKILRSIRNKGMYTLNYRLMINGEPVYVQLKATKIQENGKSTIVVGVLNVDDEIRREQEYESTISAIKAEVNLDELTGVKSKHAYVDAETHIDMEIDNGTSTEFAIAVFDINGLKEINDTRGHQAGDQHIIEGCTMICKTFKHSPVYRLGGDEFAVIVQGADYARVDELMEKIAKANARNIKSGKVSVAAGMSRYENDNTLAAVFKRADDNMYANKRELKGIRLNTGRNLH